MKQEVFTGLFLDNRRIKKSGKYPLKLRVYISNANKKKLYATKFEFTEEEYRKIYLTVKPRKEYQEIRDEIDSILLEAKKCIKNMHVFSFEQFEKLFTRSSIQGTCVFYLYRDAINELERNKQIGTSESYKQSLKSLENFILFTHKNLPKNFDITQITVEWLKKYEDYMLNKLGRSYTTIGIYLRNLRAIFNRALNSNEIKKDLYPFGKTKYQIPASKNIKKALNSDDLKLLFESKPKTEKQQMAKDFWFFSYLNSGINIKDILQLTYDQVQNEKIIFYRAKSINTSKTNLKKVNIPIIEFSKQVIEKYGNSNKSKSSFVFPILDHKMDLKERHRTIKNFTKFINQHIKILAKEIGLTESISTYFARHSFATLAIRNGASMEFVSEAFSHSNIKTTQNYFAGFEDETKSKIYENLLNFKRR